MDKEILATYFNGKNYTFDWLESDEEAREWIEDNEDKYTHIEIIRVHCIEVIYKSK